MSWPEPRYPEEILSRAVDSLGLDFLPQYLLTSLLPTVSAALMLHLRVDALCHFLPLSFDRGGGAGVLIIKTRLCLKGPDNEERNSMLLILVVLVLPPHGQLHTADWETC